ncbi:MAG: hypothetical protein OXH49_00045 [Gemmatimonadetes bacterium]|nr:hypothetical protein [Gemmatimonadota bacterium]
MTRRFALAGQLARWSATVFLAGLAALVLSSGAAAQEDEQLRGRIEYESVRLYSGGATDIAARLQIARRQVMVMRALGPRRARGPGAPWRFIGPEQIADPWRGPVAGRVSAIAIHPRNPAVLYIGGAQGGVWRSEDRGASWTPLTDYECSLAMGSIAIDPVNPDIIYAGTGEQHFSGDSYYGCGMLRSVDGGTTWQEQGTSVFRAAGRGGARISRVVVDPVTAGSLGSTTVLAATDFGLFRSTDSGRRWTLVRRGLATDLVMDPADPSVLYAAFHSDPRYGHWGIHKSSDSGRSWMQASAGLRDTDIRRVNLAIAPSAPETLYAGVVNVGDDRATRQGLLLYRSDDGAATWQELDAEGATCNHQCWYDLTLAVHPQDPDRLYLGAIILQASIDGGHTFREIHPSNLYVDQHLLVFDTLSGPNVLYLANDGGVYRSLDAGTSWTSLATNLALAQYYPGITPHPADPSVALGGTQDHGTVRSAAGTTTWTKVLGGDGGFTAIDAEDLDIWYAETQWGSGYGGPQRSGQRRVAGIDLGEDAAFLPPLVMDPIDSKRLYFGTRRLYRTDNAAEEWIRVSETFRGQAWYSRIAAIAPSLSDPNTVYISLSLGGVAVTRDAGAAWTIVGSAEGLPADRYIGDLAVHPDNADVAYAVAGGFGTGHVFQTTDGGRTWRDRTGDLPDHPVNAVLYDPETPDAVYIGTDLGVFHSPSGGDSWDMLDDGLPMAAVFDIAASPGTGRLLAATHGRGMFEIPIDVPLTARTRPTAVNDTILAGRETQAEGQVIVAPRGQGDHVALWTATASDAPWITLQGASGAGRGRFGYSIAATDLAPGDHTANIRVAVGGVADGVTIPVTVHSALPKGHMTLGRAETLAAVLQDSTAAFTDSVAVHFEGPQAATVAWTASHPGRADWFELIDTSGVGGGVVRWTIDPDSLPEGTYVDSVVVVAPLATGSPATLVYSLSVEPPLTLPALRLISSYGVSGWSVVTSDSLPSGLTGFGAASAVWTASSGSGWLMIERTDGSREDPVVWSRASESLDPGMYEDTIMIGVAGRPYLVGVIVDRIEVVAPLTVEEAARHLLGETQLQREQERFLDWFGNQDGTFNAGDVLRWLDHCAGGGEGSGCGMPPGDEGPGTETPAIRTPPSDPILRGPGRADRRERP